jgi:hypothetical protein
MQAIKYLENPQEQSNLLDPKLKNVKKESLLVVCNVVSLCMEQAQTETINANNNCYVGRRN